MTSATFKIGSRVMLLDWRGRPDGMATYLGREGAGCLVRLDDEGRSPTCPEDDGLRVVSATVLREVKS